MRKPGLAQKFIEPDTHKSVPAPLDRSMKTYDNFAKKFNVTENRQLTHLAGGPAALGYRFFWTWDHSMDWTPLAEGIQERGARNPYYKKREDFIRDYKNLIDFSSAHHFTGVIIYGFLRDSHGGIEAAKEICRYGRQKGVLIIPGVGINSYGGIYWEGKHEYSLAYWLDRHPELEALGQADRHPYARLACPSKKENKQWHRNAVRWLCETFDIGGINFETGDYGLCKCKQCQDRSDRKAKWSMEDIAELLPPLIAEAAKARPGILPICECYFDNILDADSASFRALPGNAILQFCINHSYLPRFQKEMDSKKAAQLPSRQKIIRTHMGSQWNRERHKFVAREFSELVRKIAATGLNGITIFGEVSSSETINEINYLSVAGFSDAPNLTWNEFVTQVLGPLLGGGDLAKRYIELLEKGKVGRADVDAAKSILPGMQEPFYRRWLWLVEFLHQRLETKN